MKSEIRKEIEKILGRKFETAFIDPRVDGYRLKLCTRTPCTPTEENAIISLPHVTKVKYIKHEYLSWFDGICIYFNERPKDIKLPKKEQEWICGTLPFQRLQCSNGLVDTNPEGIIYAVDLDFNEVNPELFVKIFKEFPKLPPMDVPQNPLKVELLEIRNRIDQLLNKL